MTRKHTEIDKEKFTKTCELCEIEVNIARELKQQRTYKLCFCFQISFFFTTPFVTLGGIE